MKILSVAEFARTYPGGVALAATGPTARIQLSSRDCAELSARINVRNWIGIADQFGVPVVASDGRGKAVTVRPGDKLAPTLRREYPELFG